MDAYHPGKIELREINTHLVCTLCHGYYIDATTIVECLHSFCKSCIVEYLKRSKYCPVCDVQVHKTKPLENIRADQILQDIVYKCVPRLYESEMKRRREFYAKHPEVKPNSSDDAGEAVSDISSPDEPISLSLEYMDPNENQETKICTKRYFRCPAAVTIGHLQKLIRAKFSVGLSRQVDVLYMGNVLESELTLMDISYIYSWKRKGPLSLTYCIWREPNEILKFDDWLSREVTSSTETVKKSETNTSSVEAAKKPETIKSSLIEAVKKSETNMSSSIEASKKSETNISLLIEAARRSETNISLLIEAAKKSEQNIHNANAAERSETQVSSTNELAEKHEMAMLTNQHFEKSNANMPSMNDVAQPSEMVVSSTNKSEKSFIHIKNTKVENGMLNKKNDGRKEVVNGSGIVLNNNASPICANKLDESSNKPISLVINNGQSTAPGYRCGLSIQKTDTPFSVPEKKNKCSQSGADHNLSGEYPLLQNNKIGGKITSVKLENLANSSKTKRAITSSEIKKDVGPPSKIAKKNGNLLIQSHIPQSLSQKATPSRFTSLSRENDAIPPQNSRPLTTKCYTLITDKQKANSMPLMMKVSEVYNPEIHKDTSKRNSTLIGNIGNHLTLSLREVSDNSKKDNPKMAVVYPTQMNNIAGRKQQNSSSLSYKTVNKPPKDWNQNINRLTFPLPRQFPRPPGNFTGNRDADSIDTDSRDADSTDLITLSSVSSTVSQPAPSTNDATNTGTVKQPRFFKVRNAPRYLGNPASGVKPMYQITTVPTSASELQISSSNTNKKSSVTLMKINPKVLSPVTTTCPTNTNTSSVSISPSTFLSLAVPLSLSSSPSVSSQLTSFGIGTPKTNDSSPARPNPSLISKVLSHGVALSKSYNSKSCTAHTVPTNLHSEDNDYSSTSDCGNSCHSSVAQNSESTFIHPSVNSFPNISSYINSALNIYKSSADRSQLRLSQEYLLPAVQRMPPCNIKLKCSKATGTTHTVTSSSQSPPCPSQPDSNKTLCVEKPVPSPTPCPNNKTLDTTENKTKTDIITSNSLKNASSEKSEQFNNCKEGINGECSGLETPESSATQGNKEIQRKEVDNKQASQTERKKGDTLFKKIEDISKALKLKITENNKNSNITECDSSTVNTQ